MTAVLVFAFSCGGGGGSSTQPGGNNPLNNDPVAIDDADSTNEDTPFTTLNVLTNDTDPENDTLSVVAGNPSAASGSVVNNNDGTFDYTPNLDFAGSDSFDYTISDGNGGTDVGTVSITVNPVNDAPVANADADSTNEDTPFTTLNVLSNDNDGGDGPGALAITAFDATTANGGSVSNNGDGTFHYTPSANFIGDDTFTYTVSDTMSTAVGTVTITVGSMVPGDYRTIVIFGDTQHFVRGGSRYLDFQAQIQWIIDNKAAENIDFVMAVGDLIDSGTPLPVRVGGMSVTGDECDDENPDASYTGAPYQTFGFCSAESEVNSGSEASCEALTGPTTGCFWYDDTFNPADCVPCSLAREANTEWGRFDTQFDRLLPGGDTVAGIPFLLTKGNHDNAGSDFTIDPDREPLGWNQRYSAAFWDSLDGTYIDRSYAHVNHNLAAEGDSHSWVVQIGAQPVVVVAIPYISRSGVPASAQTWAINEMAAHSDKPAIILVHHVPTVERAITNQSEVVAPNLFLVSGGHVGTNVKNIRTNGGEMILETTTDWTHSERLDTNGVLRNDYLTLVRFYNDGTIEAFDYSVSGNARDSASSNTITRQTFDILPP